MSLLQFNRVLVLLNRGQIRTHARTAASAINEISKWKVGLNNGHAKGPNRMGINWASTDAAIQEKDSQTSFANTGSTTEKTEPKKQVQVEDEEQLDWQMVSELEKYEMGKRWLATMMGEDVETFTDEKIAEAIRYLLPSHLFAKDARPSMKHPLEIFGKRKKRQVGKYGRPLHAGFYTGQPSFHDLVYNIWENLEHLDKAPAPKPEIEPAASSSFYEQPLLVRWVKNHEMEEILDCKLAESQYDLLIRRLTRIAKHPNGESSQDFLSKYQISVTEGEKKLEVTPIDEEGVVTCLGYRKEATADVKVKEGSGKFLVNNKPLTKYFYEIRHRQQAMSPLLVIDQLGRFDIDAGVIGGGLAGQAGAIRLALSRALLSFSDAFHKPLEEAGLLIRDSRVVERKKPGRKGARRKFAWVKR